MLIQTASHYMFSQFSWVHLVGKLVQVAIQQNNRKNFFLSAIQFSQIDDWLLKKIWQYMQEFLVNLDIDIKFGH